MVVTVSAAGRLDARRVAASGIDVRGDHRAACDRLGHTGIHRRAGALERRRQGVRHRHRADRLHPGTAPRVRRRPHRRDRQHHPQADERRAAASWRRLLLLARPLVGGLRAGAADRNRAQGDHRAGRAGLVGPASLHQLDRHQRLGRLPVFDRHHQRGDPGRASCACSRGCAAASTTKTSSKHS